MAAAGARAQKPVGSAPWIAAEKENMADLVEQELEEVEYPVRHEMDWLNEHMAEIFSKGQANFTDVFKTPGKMRGKTPRTARKRNVEENRVPLSEIFSSAHKRVEKNAAPSPSPFIHRVVSKTNATGIASAPSPAASRAKTLEKGLQPQYPDLTQNLNSFSQYNTDSGYHGMPDDDKMVLPDTQPETQTSTQPFEADEPVVLSSQGDVSIEPQPTEDSFHSAQEDVRMRGETVEPLNMDPTPTNERTMRPQESVSKAPESESNSTPRARTQSKPKIVAAAEKRQESPPVQQLTERSDDDETLSKIKVSEAQKQGPPSPEVEMEDVVKEDTILDDNFDDIGSPSDGSTPQRRFPMRKSSLNFASLPAREPLKGSRRSRTSHIDLSKLNPTGRPSLLGKHSAGHRVTQAVVDDEMADAGSKDLDDEKEAEEIMDVDQVSKLHNQKSTQSLHERISMLGKLQPSRPKKSIAAMAGPSAGQIPYPELPAAKPETKLEPLAQTERATSLQNSDEIEVDDWIRPLSSPQRLDLAKSKTTDVMEKLFDVSQSPSKSVGTTAVEQQSTEPERPKSSYSIFSSPRPHGHHKTASVSNIASEASTTPTGSPRRFEGPLSASKMRLQSIMKSAKGLFTSTGGSTRIESSSPEQPRLRSQQQANAAAEVKDSQSEPQPRQISSPPRQEGRRTRSSTEREEKRRQKEREDRQRDEEEKEIRQEKAREKEKQRALQIKAMQDKSSVEPEERPASAAQRPMPSQRQQSREPESAHDGSRFGLPQPKQNDRRIKPPTREPAQKPNPRPVSIRVGSTLSRPMPIPSSMTSNSQESVAPPAVSAPAPKATSLKKKGSNQSLHTASSASSFKSSVSSQTQAQRKKREQEEREVRRKEEQRKEEQKREAERKRAYQKQQEEEARRQAEAERERAERELSASEDPKKIAHMRAIERRRQENNARKHVRQGSVQAGSDAPMLQHEKTASQSSQRNDLGATRPASRLGYGRPINPPAPNPAKPPKRNLDEESGYRVAVTNPNNVQPSGEAKRRKTEDEHNPMQPLRPTMAPPIRQSNIRKQPSMFGQSGSSIFKTGQPQRPAHPSELAKYTNNKIPFAEPNHAPPPAVQKATAPGSAQRPPPAAKPSPKYPSGENIHLPEIATDSEDEDDSDSEIFPVPKWAQPKELEGLLREQDGMEVDSIFGPIAPFSLEETFKADKKIKKYRDRTSSANWNGPDGLTMEEIRKDRIERQKLRLNGGWSFQQ
ncbi:uncharacterized protein N7473_001948 [Penicillium subrubescens]|uniref:Inner centromere protein ARK-binding domain-containing protein n=1 Tax=Penicillium subrubescens TaxID=1316194 RepID=A0A1Q5SQP2_9EURO|nr:uncharacterized protein N7473_001948 [Penicillium subrubescens]KAJ5905032.1 hypothetical protein N7473_001948 [Penicillium subrubescens]OKO90318.1 hypothetical protein PENSUB_13451 [Penicillium subrubescens]